MNHPRLVSFRRTLWQWLPVAGGVSLLAYAVLSLLTEVVLFGGRGFHRPEYWASQTTVAVVVAVCLPVVLILHVLIWRVRIDPDTLSAPNLWDSYVSVSWDSVREVRPFNLLTLPYLRVYSTETRRVIWLPLFLVNYRRFAELVAEYAGEDHPVTRAVWQRIDDS